MSDAPLTDDELREIGYEPTAGGLRPIGGIPPAEEPDVGDLDVPDTQVPLPATPRDRLAVVDVTELARMLESASVEWLIQGLWPADAYGVLGAEDKAGKTWAALDLAASVVTGSPWVDHFACPTTGSVLVFLGEGGPRATLRRLQAIATSKELDIPDLRGLRLCFAVPRLTNRQELERVRVEVEAHPPRLVVLDPLYLAAAGAKGSDLYGMGEALGAIQELCQAAGSALVVVTHWNKTGEGGGARRFTGVGPGAWGRVLGSAAIERRATDPDGTSDVLLRWDFTGGEIADQTFRMRRRVRAEDPAALDSALQYAVDVTETAPDVGEDGMAPAERRVLDALEGPDRPLSVHEVGDVVARDGKFKPLTRPAIQKALGSLLEKGLADADKPGPGQPNRWWRT